MAVIYRVTQMNVIKVLCYTDFIINISAARRDVSWSAREMRIAKYSILDLSRMESCLIALADHGALWSHA